jgi:hypothetical protein
MIPILSKSQILRERRSEHDKRAAVTEAIMLNGVIDAGPAWLAPVSEHRQMSNFSTLAARELLTVR